jgi:hypothetical protein
VLLVAIISAVGTALAGVAAVISALAALGVLRGRRAVEHPELGTRASPVSTSAEHTRIGAPTEDQPEKPAA